MDYKHTYTYFYLYLYLHINTKKWRPYLPSVFLCSSLRSSLMETFDQRNIWRQSIRFFCCCCFLLKRYWSKGETVKGGKDNTVKIEWGTFCEAKFHSDYQHLIYFSWHLLNRYMVAYVTLPHSFPPGHSFVCTPSAVNL